MILNTYSYIVLSICYLTKCRFTLYKNTHIISLIFAHHKQSMVTRLECPPGYSSDWAVNTDILYLCDIANSHQCIRGQAGTDIKYWLKFCQHLLLSRCVYICKDIKQPWTEYRRAHIICGTDNNHVHCAVSRDTLHVSARRLASLTTPGGGDRY